MNTQDLPAVVSELIDLIKKFPPEQRTVKHFSEWTIREVIEHISGWNLRRIGELEDFSQGKDVEIIPDYDVFNRQVIRQKRYYSWEQLFNEFERSCHDLVKAFESVPEEKAEAKIWADRNSTPRSWLQVDVEHLRDGHIVAVAKIPSNFSTKQD